VRNPKGGQRVKNPPIFLSRFALCAAGFLTIAVFANSPAAAQSSDAADRCTGDVMRLCSEFVPDPDRIVVCLKAKRRQLTPSCMTALTGGSGEKATKTTKNTKKKRRVRRTSN
jgi:hypothetical protein